jgi:hypothetical protein
MPPSLIDFIDPKILEVNPTLFCMAASHIPRLFPCTFARSVLIPAVIPVKTTGARATSPI